MRLRWLKKIGVFALFIALTACVTDPNTVYNPAPVSQLTQVQREYSQGQYVITPGDELDIRFRNNPELNEIRLPVRPDGRITLQLIDEIKAAGLTTSQLKLLLTEKYSSEIRKPEITITIRSFTNQRVFVDGEVLFPGIFDLRGPTTVMNAIAMARGVRETARLTNVIVIRKDAEGKTMSTNLDMKSVIDGTDLSQDIYLMPYDIVYVPKSRIANLDKFVAQYINTVIPGGFPGWTSFTNPYTFSFGGRTDFVR